jgi:hypothetical protein
MAVNLTQSRSMLAACVVLLVGVGIVVAFGVIPPVRAATAPSITPDSAVPAFWGGVGLEFLAALVLALTAALSKKRSGLSTSVLIVTGVLALFLGFVLSDAASAFREAAMTSVATLLLACVAADALAGGLIIATALLRPKKTLPA